MFNIVVPVINGSKKHLHFNSRLSQKLGVDYSLSL